MTASVPSVHRVLECLPGLSDQFVMLLGIRTAGTGIRVLIETLQAMSGAAVMASGGGRLRGVAGDYYPANCPCSARRGFSPARSDLSQAFEKQHGGPKPVSAEDDLSSAGSD
ncbi:hypothetical protein D9M70_621400 [compost metagenome]